MGIIIQSVSGRRQDTLHVLCYVVLLFGRVSRRVAWKMIGLHMKYKAHYLLSRFVSDRERGRERSLLMFVLLFLFAIVYFIVFYSLVLILFVRAEQEIRKEEEGSHLFSS